MSIGETVLLTEGPFLGMYGTIVSSLRRRVVVAVVFASREVQVEIDRAWTSAAAPRRRSISRIEISKLSHRTAGS
jgi:hypothetical protein